MTYIPPLVARTPLIVRLLAAGLELLFQGKVRDTFSLPGHPELLLQVTSDRISIFDFVLGDTIPDKGAVLAALTVAWLEDLLPSSSHHLVARGAEIDRYLPQTLRNDAELQKRALVIRRLEIVPVEGVVRGYLTGSGWAAYQKGEPVCGHVLPEGLHDGSKLPRPILTPTTKAETGHDTAITIQSFRQEYPHAEAFEAMCLAIYNAALEVAEDTGLILADTKFELGWLGGDLVIGDEVLTPDSSRFWDKEEWRQAQEERKSPPGYDKQHTREWGKTVETPFGVTGINALDTENLAHCEFVGRVPIPGEVRSFTCNRYRKLVGRLTGRPLDEFWADLDVTA